MLPAAATGITPLAVAVWGFAVWLVATNGWLNPSYSAAAPYHAAFLLGGFILGRRAGPGSASVVFVASLFFVLCIAVWALYQAVTDPSQRAHALFETPATLAALLNLLLVPALVALAFGSWTWPRFAAVIVLGAASIAAASLGGWLALALGAVLAGLLAHRAGLRLQARALVMALLIGWLAAWLLPILSGRLPDLGSGAARLDLYRLALRELSISSALTGHGYLGFYYLMEAARDTIRTYGSSTTYFVHNDYLQVLLELGIPGLAMFLGLVVLPLAIAWRSLPRLGDDKARLVVVGAGAAAGTMALHALVDFPFYVPVCVALYGVAIGVVDASAGEGFAWEHPAKKAAVAALATLGAVLIIKPALAEVAAAQAQRQWASTHAESAAYWFEVARRLEPRDWRYHWYAGQFWFSQARHGGRPEAARLADEAYAAGYAANPREVRNLLGRILTQGHLRPLLASPVDEATLRAWIDTAVRLAPLEPALRELQGRR